MPFASILLDNCVLIHFMPFVLVLIALCPSAYALYYLGFYRCLLIFAHASLTLFRYGVSFSIDLLSLALALLPLVIFTICLLCIIFHSIIIYNFMI